MPGVALRECVGFFSSLLRFDGASPDLEAIQRMSEKLARRGPDQGGGVLDYIARGEPGLMVAG